MRKNVSVRVRASPVSAESKTRIKETINPINF